MLPESMAAEIKLGTWPILPIFGCLQKYGEIPMMEMYEIFNMGIGMVLAVEEAKVKEIVHEIEQAGEKVYEIGKVIAKENIVWCLQEKNDENRCFCFWKRKQLSSASRLFIKKGLEASIDWLFCDQPAAYVLKRAVALDVLSRLFFT